MICQAYLSMLKSKTKFECYCSLSRGVLLYFIGMYIFIYIYQCFRKQRGLRMWLTFADKREGRVRSYLNSPYVILQWTRGLNQSKCPFDALWSTPYNMFLLMIIITFFLINL